MCKKKKPYEIDAGDHPTLFLLSRVIEHLLLLKVLLLYSDVNLKGHKGYRETILI